MPLIERQPNPHNRRVLRAAETLYVATTGSDASGTGSSSAPFATPQAAYDYASSSLDLGVYDLTVSVAAGTYGQLQPKSIQGAGKLILEGAGDTTIIGGATYGVYREAPLWGQHRFKDLKLKPSADNKNALSLLGPAFLELTGVTLEISGGNSSHMLAAAGGQIVIIGNVTCKGSGQACMYPYEGGRFRLQAGTFTTDDSGGAPAFALAWVYAASGGALRVFSAVTLAGSATGKRYDVLSNAIVQSAGKTFPGSLSGTTASGGHYGS